MAPPIRILVVDDHPVVREGLAAIIGTQADMCVVGEAADGAEALDLFNLQIAVALDLSEHTVNIHVKNILSKLGVSGRTEAVTVALRKGILHLD